MQVSKAIFLHSFPMLFRSLSIYMNNGNGNVNITQKGIRAAENFLALTFHLVQFVKC